MIRTRTDKSWATAYVGEQRQPQGVQGGGRWTAGIINPAAQGRQGRGGKKPAAAPPADAPAGTEARMAAQGGDAEDAGERAQAQAALREAAELETQIDQLKAELKAVTRQYNALTGPSNTPPSKPGAAPGAASGAAPNNTAAAAAASRSYTQQVNRLQSQSAQLQAQISRLVRQRAKLLSRASNLMRDARKSASTTTRSRVASVLTPVAEKAATMNGQDLVYATFPIEKWEEGPDGSLYVYGRATTPEVDTDEQIVDGDWSAKALQAWMDTGPNLRVQHNGQRDPAGSGVRVEINRDGDGAHWVKSVVDEPVAARLVRKGHLRAYSVGIARPVIERDATGKARGGIIKGGELAELSLVDRPANRSCTLSLVKAAKDGHAEFPGTLAADEAFLAKAGAPEVTKAASDGDEGVTVTLPENMSLSVKPSDLAKLATFKQKLVTGQATVVKTAAPIVAKGGAGGDTTVPTGAGGGGGAAGEPFTVLKAVMAAEADVYKRDIDAATRQRLASAGRALPDGSYPIETHEDAGNAVTLALSGHGNAAAARKLIKRIASKEGWQDILDRLKGSDGGKVAKAAAAEAKQQQGKARKAVRAALAPVAEPDAVKKKGKLRAICPGCGAKQNPAHAHCPECGGKLPPGAMTVAKNHDFVCLGCGKEQDKGEKFCPGCGKENPGYNPGADKKIPANQDKSGKARVAKGKGKNGKRPTPGEGVAGEAARNEKPAGRHREPDGAEVEAFERDAHMEDGDDEKPARLEAHTFTEAAKRAKAGKKGKKPKKGKKLPPWLQDKDGDDDGDAAEKAAFPDGFSDPEVQAALRLKTLGVPLRLGITHDLVCPAYHPAEVRLCYPAASLKTLDLAEWQARADSGGIPLSEAQKGLDLWNAALTLKNADPADVDDLRDGLHKEFRSANLDAKPGPGSFPSPMQISAAQFRRPYISAGHAAASPGHDAPHSAKIPPSGGIHPGDFQRGYISAGHADESPSNTHPPAPMPAPDRTGEATQGPARTYYRNTARDAASHAMAVLHDHIAIHHPGLCPMTGSLAERPVPTPEGVPPVHPAPGSRGLGKSAKAAARKDARRAERKAVRAGKRKAAKIRRKARDRRRGLEAKVLKGKLTVEEARAKLGLEPVTKAATAAIPPTPESPAATVTQIEPDALKSAVRAATKPLIKQIRQQGKTIRKVRKTADAIAAQPDTSGAPFRGVALAKSAAPSPAGALSIAQPVEQAQASRYADLYDIYRNSPDPAERRTAFDALRPFWDPSLAKQ